VDGEPNEFASGPIVEVAEGPFVLTLNPLFTKQIGRGPGRAHGSRPVLVLYTLSDSEPT
jgi:hypothetical protein